MNNEKRFALFPNRYKQKDTHPDYTGELTLDGVVYRISGWKQEKNDLVYVSGNIQEKQEFEAPQPAPTPKPKPKDDDFIPF